jgi:carboxyl-terminal processing protease
VAQNSAIDQEIMSKTFKRSVFGISVLLVVFAILGSMRPNGVRAGAQTDGAYPEMEVYSEVLNKIQNDYVVDPNMNNVTVGALHGLLESLDADSSFLTPDEYKLYKQHQNEGSAQVGLNVSKRYGYATVISVEPDSPASKEHIGDGDIIEAIDTQSTREMSLAMIRLMLEGPAGSNVTVSVVRPRKSEPDKVVLKRGNTPVPSLAEQEYENASIYSLRPVVLTKDRVNDIESKLKGIEKGGHHKVILDLRDVAEGDEAQGIRLANFFLQSGTIATLAGQKFPSQTFTADPKLFVTNAPLVVLVNHGTSGAGELVAGAILGNKRGDVVGDRTFGEGAVQKTIDLPDGSALILSVAKYSTPAGKKIQDEAVVPNVVVASNQDVDDTSDGSAIDQGPTIEGKPKTVPGPANPTPVPAKTQQDDQLNKALEILKAKNV